ncbi:hypothetical protein EDEG_03462 [Edhazardia aedis USNM 41457]|uniref:Uncharacterized protein n=1 Tax=Edhazardia aedis (strain USNM 41457) TaxID=1003232 RepID=J9DL72_EDHAE|nr:hypothetical protein EDEG_03462 [Edhazardia aedis USNM 41457]|eukprot:EJW02102.1 hypothetical protein EDEG_03462 [Edhazardia aedis USNM 41457]
MFYLLLIIFSRVIYDETTVVPTTETTTQARSEFNKPSLDLYGFDDEEKAELQNYINLVASQRPLKIKNCVERKSRENMENIRKLFKSLEVYIFNGLMEPLNTFNVTYKNNIVSSISSVYEKIALNITRLQQSSSVNGDHENSYTEQLNKNKEFIDQLKYEIGKIFNSNHSEYIDLLSKTFSQKYNFFVDRIEILSKDVDLVVGDGIEFYLPKIDELFNFGIEKHKESISTISSLIFLEIKRLDVFISEHLFSSRLIVRDNQFEKFKNEIQTHINDVKKIIINTYDEKKPKIVDDITKSVESYENLTEESLFRMLAYLSIDFKQILNEITENEIDDAISRFG